MVGVEMHGSGAKLLGDLRLEFKLQLVTHCKNNLKVEL